MNLMLAIAGGLSLGLCGVHVIAGGRDAHRPMLQSELPLADKSLWSVVWHIVSVLLAVNGLVLLLASVQPPRMALALAVVPLAMTLASAVLFIGYGIGRLGSLTRMPQWTAFALIAVLIVVGLAR